MLRRLILALPVMLAPAGVAAQEFVPVPGLISDEDFYRLVACAAPPGGGCAKPMIRWPETRRHPLRIGIAAIAPGFPGYKFDLVDRAIDTAIDQINATGADLVLMRVFEGALDVPFYLVETPQGGRIEGTSIAELDGADIAMARVALRSRGGDIHAAAIAISQDIGRREIISVVLEELVQSLGLPTDIDGPAYDRSIFSETTNSAVWLRGQDATALRRHYPRP